MLIEEHMNTMYFADLKKKENATYAVVAIRWDEGGVILIYLYPSSYPRSKTNSAFVLF